MWQTIVEAVLEFLAEWLIALFWWIILFPVVWLVSLPFILVIALFRRGRYDIVVTNMLSSVDCFWREWGLYFTL
jgi:hypothetical protein